MGGAFAVAADEKLLDQFLSRAKPDLLDGDFALGVVVVRDRQTRKLDHQPRQIEDPNGLPHVEQQHLAVVGESAGLDDQLRGFGNGHEVTSRLAVSDRHWTADGDLLAEAGNDGAARAEHVAEADAAIARLLLRRRASLHDQFADALGRPHHVRWPNRLVRADEDELANAAAFGGHSRRKRAQDIVPDASDRIALHHWHMLVRSGMEHRVDGITPEHPLALTFVGDVHELGPNFNRELLAPNDFPKLDIDRVEGVLGMLGKDDEARPLADDLPAEFASDRSACTRYEHSAASDIALHEDRIRSNLVAAEQLLDLHLSQVADGNPARSDL